MVCTALKNNDEVIATLYERILGRVSVHDIVHPTTGKLIVAEMCIRDRGEAVKVVVGRLAEVRFIDVNTGIILSTHNVPYGSKLYAAEDVYKRQP